MEKLFDVILPLVSALLPSLIVALVMAVINRRQKKRDEMQDALAEARKEETLLHLNLQMATAKLAYATAMALKRGRANGEVEEGVEAYEDAKRAYTAFLNKQATEHLSQ